MWQSREISTAESTQKPSQIPHQNEYSKFGMQQLYNKAVNSCSPSRMNKCSYLYRNKDRKYFEDMVNNKNGIMNPYYKDSGNDPLNPMNQRLAGLFFMASTGVAGEVAKESPFGNTRLMIPVENLMRGMNLYFADFFCLQGNNHYITLVACKPGSKTETFCQDKLIQISLMNNNFFISVDQENYMVLNNDKIKVEIVITHPIDLKKELKMLPHKKDSYIFYGVPTVGSGFSKKHGVLKNAHCAICNIPIYNLHQCIQLRSKAKFIHIWHYKESKGDGNFVFTTTGKYVNQTNKGKYWLVHTDEQPVSTVHLNLRLRAPANFRPMFRSQAQILPAQPQNNTFYSYLSSACHVVKTNLIDQPINKDQRTVYREQAENSTHRRAYTQIGGPVTQTQDNTFYTFLSSGWDLIKSYF